ncbi:MAG: hypothetical protein AB4352_20120 [Hormoscilla sp.]
MKNTLTAITTLFIIILGTESAKAASVTLYDGVGLPISQGELIPGALNSSGLPVASDETAVSGGVQVDTNANLAEYSGYSNYNPLTSTFVNSPLPYTLDQSLGYSIVFNVTLNSTTSNNPNRAAFSITAIGVGNQGIELAFEPNSIFAQNADFTLGENQPFTTNSNTDYELRVTSSNYQLFANSSQILTGSLRTYNFNPLTSDPPLGTFNPYEIPNFIFLGDNTGQEDGEFTLRSASVTTNTTNTAGAPFKFSPTFGVLIMVIATTIYELTNRKKNRKKK